MAWIFLGFLLLSPWVFMPNVALRHLGHKRAFLWSWPSRVRKPPLWGALDGIYSAREKRLIVVMQRSSINDVI